MIDQTTTTAVTDAAHQGTEMLSSQFGGAIILAYALQWAKNSKLVPFVSEHTKGINYAVTGIMSLVATVGIHYSFDAAAGVLTIGGLTAASITHGIWEWVRQWGFQQASSAVIFSKAVAEQVQTGNVERPTGITLAKDL